MTPELESITLTSFRSINTSVRIPLDAPVVLIHGQNGTGKTSILSGIELALTGDIPSLRRIDSGYRQHLVHKNATSARLDLIARGLPDGRSEATMTITSNAISGRPLLTPDLAKTYSERCYLAQATLGKLLEIYQGQDAQSNSSPLTLFVKELLGLDVFEFIVDGLHDAGDVRRIRNAVPAYSEVERRISEVERRLRQISGGLKDINAAIAVFLEELRVAAIPLGLSITSAFSNYRDALKELEANSFKNRLMTLARIRRDLLAARERLATIEASSGVGEQTRLEENDLLARRQLEEWRLGRGKLLNETINSLLSIFPSLPSADSGDPEVARSTALRAVESEIRRYSDLITKQEQVARRLEDIRTEVERLGERSRRLNEQIGSHASNAGNLAQALAGLLPHIHSEECPVCGRDYEEISTTPLVSEISRKINILNESGSMLEALSKEQSATIAQLSVLRREQDGLAASQLSQIAAEEANADRAHLQLAKQRLDGLADDAVRGTVLIQNAGLAARKLTEVRESDDQLSSLIETVRQAASQLMKEFSFPNQTLGFQVSQLLEFTETEEASLNAFEENRARAISRIQALQAQQSSRDSLAKEQSDFQLELENLRSAKGRADKTIDVARTFSKKVLEVRTSIVQRVFNESLNKLWADLFTRLAPEENFVPAFAIPQRTSVSVEAVLETIYRKGQRGGNPQTMLSAGNLNTAALTLFLALHLSLDPKLPWLLIDDPVQSMDEVHIAQFAALLRTLSKRSGRRVVIAIHERPLYEYLALELSPAFPEDKLITIELGRNASGDTFAKATHHIWQDDRAISAA